MGQGFFGVDSSGWVNSDQFEQQVKRNWVEVRQADLRIHRAEFWERRLEVWELGHSRPGLVCWGSVELENLENLIDLRITLEKWLGLNEFREDTPDSPHINTQSILLLPKQNLRSSVPQSLDLVGQRPDRHGKSSCQTEISKFDNIVLWVNQQILGFQISVDNSSLMAMQNPLDQLVHECLYDHWRQTVLVLIQVFFEIHLEIFKNDIEPLVSWDVDNIFQRHDIDVV